MLGRHRFGHSARLPRPRQCDRQGTRAGPMPPERRPALRAVVRGSVDRRRKFTVEPACTRLLHATLSLPNREHPSPCARCRSDATVLGQGRGRGVERSPRGHGGPRDSAHGARADLTTSTRRTTARARGSSRSARPCCGRRQQPRREQQESSCRPAGDLFSWPVRAEWCRLARVDTCGGASRAERPSERASRTRQGRTRGLLGRGRFT